MNWGMPWARPGTTHQRSAGKGRGGRGWEKGRREKQAGVHPGDPQGCRGPVGPLPALRVGPVTKWRSLTAPRVLVSVELSPASDWSRASPGRGGPGCSCLVAAHPRPPRPRTCGCLVHAHLRLGAGSMPAQSELCAVPPRASGVHRVLGTTQSRDPRAAFGGLEGSPSASTTRHLALSLGFPAPLTALICLRPFGKPMGHKRHFP